MSSKSIESYLAEKRANGVKESTIRTVGYILGTMDKIKPLTKCSEADLKTTISKLKVNEKSLVLYKIYMKNFFKWCGESDKIKWIKIKKVKSPIHEDDLLTPDEIKKLLDGCQSPRDSALIALLSESACRISEALNLNINDLSKVDYGFKMRIRDGKTGARDISLISSVPHIVQWLNIHPLKSDINSPLFVGMGVRNRYGRMNDHAARKTLREITKRTGINKRVHPHLFRHSTLTTLASDGMQESILRKLAGWSGSSEMPAVYIHIGNKDVEQAQLAMHGKATAQHHLSKSPLTKECPNCHKDMPIEAQYCNNCSKHQELTPVVKRLLEEHQQTIANAETIQAKIAEMEEQRKKDQALNEDMIKAMIETRVKQILKNHTT